MDNKNNVHRELGRRLLAAVLSCRYGNIAMDYTLKHYIPKEIDPSWGELGWRLLCTIASQTGELLPTSDLN
jgi:hypothetical protein